MAITLDGTTGITTPGLINTGAETVVNLTTSGNTILGDASTDTLNVGNGGLVKDASGNVGIGIASPTAKLTVSGNQSFAEKTAAYIGVDIATTAGNGGNLTIKAGNGSGSGNTSGNLYVGAGRGSVSATSGFIAFGTAQATNAVGLDTEYMRLDSSGNLGLGVTPSAWGSNFKAMQIGAGVGTTAIIGRTAQNNSQFGNNFYFDGTNYVYVGTGYSSRYSQVSGNHEWHIASSGTAGNAITFTQAMTLTAGGNLGIGTASPASQLQIYPTTANIFTEGLRVNREGQTGQYAIVNYSGGAYNVLAVDSLFSAPAISFKTSTNGTTTTERMSIDASGNLIVGTASVSDKLSSFTNTQSSACLAQGTYITGGVLFASTYSASSSNNATVDAFLFRNSAGSTIGSAALAGHFYVRVTGGSGVNQYCAVYTILTTGNGTSSATLALVNTAQTRGTSPVSSVGIANDGVGGAIKLRITYINNGGVVDFGSSVVSFIGTTL